MAVKKSVKLKLSPAQLEQLALLFKTIGDPSRLALLQRLMQSPATVGTLVKELGLKQANVSKQLGVLYRARLVSRLKTGLQVEYKLRHKALNKLCGAACELMRGCSEGLSF